MLLQWFHFKEMLSASEDTYIGHDAKCTCNKSSHSTPYIFRLCVSQLIFLRKKRKVKIWTPLSFQASWLSNFHFWPGLNNKNKSTFLSENQDRIYETVVSKILDIKWRGNQLHDGGTKWNDSYHCSSWLPREFPCCNGWMRVLVEPGNFCHLRGEDTVECSRSWMLVIPGESAALQSVPQSNNYKNMKRLLTASNEYWSLYVRIPLEAGRETPKRHKENIFHSSYTNEYNICSNELMEKTSQFMGHGLRMVLLQ